MSSIGPQLPPSPQKRKHAPDPDDSSPSSKAQRTTGPVANPNTDEIDLEDGSDDDYGPAPPAPAPAEAAPSIGPTLPPAQPPVQDDSSDSDSEDDYGPALPSASGAPIIGPSMPPAPSTEEEAVPQRDDWMLAPPPSGGPFTERDTTKIRARKFTSGKSAGAKGNGGGGGEVNSMWTETPEQKLARLQDAVLGRSSGAAQQDGGDDSVRKEQEERNRRIAANIEGSRGRSLVEEHTKQRKESGKADEDDDDPSKRGFDREKDMALGGRLGSTQRKELLNKSANFGGRFSKGSFL